MWKSRAVAPVIGVLVLVATTVVTAGLVAVVALGPSGVDHDGDVGGGTALPSATARFTAESVDADEQRVTLLYLAGTPLDVDSLEIVVEVGGRTGRLVDLPAGRGERCYGDPDDVLGTENVRNATVFSRACGATSGAITAKASDGVWRPGESASFTVKLAASGGVDLESGDDVRVAVVDDERKALLCEVRAEVT